MLDSKLLNRTYYDKLFPLYIQNSYGITGDGSQVEAFFDFLNNINSCEDTLFNMMNVMGKVIDSSFDYFENAPIGYNEVAFNHPMLDIIGQIYGLSREMRLLDYDENGSPLATYSIIKLCNKHFLEYIQLTIIKNNFNGTRADLISVYMDNNALSRYSIRYRTNDTAGNSANCTIYYQASSNTQDIIDQKINGETITQVNGLKWLFQNGLLTIESAGINYTRSLTNIAEIGIFGTGEFDEARFA